jgi:hypothetical protein
MSDPRPVSGKLSVGIRVAPNGEPCVFLEFPDGSGFLVPRGDALCFAFGILAQTRNLFASVAELEEAVIAAKARADMLDPRPMPLQ